MRRMPISPHISGSMSMMPPPSANRARPISNMIRGARSSFAERAVIHVVAMNNGRAQNGVVCTPSGLIYGFFPGEELLQTKNNEKDSQRGEVETLNDSASRPTQAAASAAPPISANCDELKIDGMFHSRSRCQSQYANPDPDCCSIATRISSSCSCQHDDCQPLGRRQQRRDDAPKGKQAGWDVQQSDEDSEQCLR